MTNEIVPVAGPWITPLEVELVARAAETAWYGDAGRFVREFETRFAEHIGRRFAIALPSCTAGIHLALLGLGIAEGDEVIVPDVTWIASAAPVTYVGAATVFADIDERTWCLDVDAFESAITPRTKAVIPVDLYGGMPDMDRLLRLAATRGIAVIEDAAEAIGSSWRGRPAGSFGLASVFSFHGSKTLTTGEGGMFLTDDEALYERVLMLRDHGREPGDQRFDNVLVAQKYKMSDLQAALGLGQLERIAELVARKREIFHGYAEVLGQRPELTLNAEPQGTVNAYWMVTAILDRALGITKDDLQARLRSEGIATRPFFRPLSSLRAYAHAPSTAGASERNRVSYAISPFGINLPSALRLDHDDIERTCDALVAALAG